jgi:hypothetical protein
MGRNPFVFHKKVRVGCACVPWYEAKGQQFGIDSMMGFVVAVAPANRAAVQFWSCSHARQHSASFLTNKPLGYVGDKISPYASSRALLLHLLVVASTSKMVQMMAMNTRIVFESLFECSTESTERKKTLEYFLTVDVSLTMVIIIIIMIIILRLALLQSSAERKKNSNFILTHRLANYLRRFLSRAFRKFAQKIFGATTSLVANSVNLLKLFAK